MFVFSAVAHKGFPEADNCVVALEKIINGPANQPLDHFTLQKFEQFIKGLKIVYEIPGQKSSKRTYKISGLADAPMKKE